jgi:hypothetical protein
MPNDHDRDQQDADCDGEQAAHPALTWLTMGGESDSDHQDDQQQGAQVETKAPHVMVPQQPVGLYSADQVSEKRLPVSRRKLTDPMSPSRRRFQWTLLFSIIDRTGRWLAREMMLTGVTSNRTPTCPKSRKSSGKRSRKGRFVSVPILMAAFASCQFDSLRSETLAHPVPKCNRPITPSGSAQ